MDCIVHGGAESDTNERLSLSHSLAYEISQPIKTNHPVFQGLLPSEMAHTLSAKCVSPRDTLAFCILSMTCASLFWIEVWLLYCVVLLSAVGQSESAGCTHMPSHPSPSPPQSSWALSGALCIPLVVRLTGGPVCMSRLPSRFAPPSTSLCVHKSPLYVCMYIAALLMVHRYHLSRFYIYGLIYDVFLFLTSLYMTDSTNDPISFLFMFA